MPRKNFSCSLLKPFTRNVGLCFNGGLETDQQRHWQEWGVNHFQKFWVTLSEGMPISSFSLRDEKKKSKKKEIKCPTRVPLFPDPLRKKDSLKHLI